MMTVKELKEKLNHFDDNLYIMIPNEKLYLEEKPTWYVPAKDVSLGTNEFDNCLFIDSEDD